MKSYCLELVKGFLFFSISKCFYCAEPKGSWGAGLKRTALGISFALGMFAGTKALAATTYTVTTLADTAGSCSGPSCTTLRAAITAANVSAGNAINFTGLSGTITLTSALPTITQSMTITGPGAGTLTVAGNNQYQILNISSGTVAVYGLTFANANTSGSGGAISSAGTLTVTNSTFSGNSAVNYGGAIRNNAGMLTVIDSMFSGNYASSNGGAISNTGTLTVANSTFSENFGGYQAAGGAGAIYSTGTLMVTGNTFSGNSGNYGGAIYNFGNSATINNNIFTGNSSQYGKGAGILDDKGTVNANYNLYYQNLKAGTTEDDCNSCATNTNAITGINPHLAALGSYGGPTQSLLPQPGSPAICGGSTSLIPSGVTTDQRGFGRTTTYNGSTCVDLGAIQTDYTAVAFSSSSYSGTVNQALNPAPIVTVTENGQNIGGVSVILAYSGTGSPGGLGPVTTVAGTGSTFGQITSASAAQGTLSVNLPITASGSPIQPTALTASANLSIQLAAQNITFVAPSSLTYGSAPITLIATGGGSGNPVTFSLDAATTPGAATLSGSRLTITGTGTVVIVANQASGGAYSAAAQVQQSIVIIPALVVITASSPTVTYGSAVPTITPIFGSFFNGDTSAVLTKQPICVTAYTTTSTVGSSPSTSCSGAAAANYIFTYINGSVTITPAPTFAIASGNPSIIIARGATTGNTAPITVTPSGGFTGNVALTAVISQSPTDAQYLPTLSFGTTNPVSITGTASGTATLIVTTTAASQAHLSEPGKGFPPLYLGGGVTFACLFFLGRLGRRRQWAKAAGILTVLLTIAGGIQGCSHGGGTKTSTQGTSPGTYTVTITGTSGSLTATNTITITVQ